MDDHDSKPPSSVDSPSSLKSSSSGLTNLVTLVFTDIVGSTAIKQQLGDRIGAQLLEEHDQLVRSLLTEFPRGQEIGTAGDSFFCAFTTPSEAVKFALIMQARLREFNQGRATPLTDRIGIHMGEVLVKDPTAKLRSKDLYGLSLDTCARIMGLADGGRILMTRPVYDNARAVLKWEEIPGVGEVLWRNHGKYALKGLDEPIEICEVGETRGQSLEAPASSEKALRHDDPASKSPEAWPPLPGTVLINRYQVGDFIGSGGMGAVHRGLDLNLNRTIALKFVPAGLASNLAGIDRLQREAKALAALNHPHVVTVFSVEETGGRHFIVMEFIQGEPLTKFIPEGGMRLAEFLELAVPLAEALEAAHSHGVIHRDLKPANIMIVAGRRVKVIDFGLAKLQPQESAQTRGLPSSSEVTREATLLGTPAYMSPEQAQGLPLDARSDLFSLGTIFYQMLTGKRPFPGESSAAIISSVLRDKPQPVIALRPDLPEPLSHLVSACLEKETSRRLGSAREALSILNGLRTGLTTVHSSALTPLPVASPRRSKTLAVALAVVLLAGVALLLSRSRQKEAPPSSTAAKTNQAAVPQPAAGPRFLAPHPLLAGVESDEYPVFSPDGQRLAFVRTVDGFKHVFVKSLVGDSSLVQVTTEPRDHIQPDWSPDAQALVYAGGEEQYPTIKASDVWGGVISGSQCDIYTYSFSTRRHRKILEGAANPRFNAQGQLAYHAPSGAASRIWTCDQQGLQKRPVTEDLDTVDHWEPSWSPDGGKIVFRRQAGKYQAKLAVVDLSTRKIVDLTGNEFISDPVWSPNGKHIYFTANLNSGFNLWRIAVKPAGEAGSPVEPVTFGIGRDLHARLSQDGKRLAYTILSWNSDIWAMPMNPASGKPDGDPFPLVVSPREDTRGDWSGDSRKLVFTSDRNGEMNLYRADFDAAKRTLSAATQITFDKGGDYQATWNPKGGQVAYFSRKSGNEDIWLVEVDAAGKPKGTPKQLTTSPAADVNPVFSPDGRHIAFMSGRNGAVQPWVMAADGSNQRLVSVETTGGHYLRWMDTNSILFPHAGILRGFLDGREPERFSSKGGAHITLSPDLKFVADNDHTSILSHHYQSNEFEKIFTFPEKGVGVDYTVWSPDGKFLLFDRSNPQGGDLYYLDGVE